MKGAEGALLLTLKRRSFPPLAAPRSPPRTRAATSTPTTTSPWRPTARCEHLVLRGLQVAMRRRSASCGKRVRGAGGGAAERWGTDPPKKRGKTVPKRRAPRTHCTVAPWKAYSASARDRAASAAGDGRAPVSSAPKD